MRRSGCEGVIVERVRIFARPLTDYTRFEFAAYSDNIAAAEKVRVIERSCLRTGDRGWANEDFWSFDDEIAVLLRYDERGRFLGVDRAGKIQRYLAAKDRAISISVELDDVATDWVDAAARSTGENACSEFWSIALRTRHRLSFDDSRLPRRSSHDINQPRLGVPNDSTVRDGACARQ